MVPLVLRCVLCLPLLAAVPPARGEPCARSVGELRALAGDAAFALRWTETSMSDGKPLVVSIADGEGALVLRFWKTQEGLWAQGRASVCRAGAGLEAHIAAEHMTAGPAAHWLLRQSLRRGARFVLAPLGSGQWNIATAGWSGAFVAAHD